MRKLFVVLLLLPSLVQAKGDHNFGNDGQTVSRYYMTGGVSSGFNPSEFPSQRGQRLERSTKPLSPELAELIDKAKDTDRHTLAIMLVDHGVVVYESNDDARTEYMGWSLAKSITGLLVGQALCSGDIKSLTDPAAKYAPELAQTVYGRATIEDLLTMRSGAPGPDREGTGESPGEFYLLTRGLRSQLDLINKPKNLGPGYEKSYTYDNLNTSALGIVLNRLRGFDYYMKNLTQQAQTERPINWFSDRDRQVNASYGMGATLDDWAHLAQYSVDTFKGRHGDKCMQDYMTKSVQPAVKPEETDSLNKFFGYGYSVWTHPKIKNGYAWFGMYGQKVFVDPNNELVLIVFRTRQDQEFNQRIGAVWSNWRNTVRSQTAAAQGSVTVDFRTKK
jgi:CubicO group peptidase (beta-lactamase class C family)